MTEYGLPFDGIQLGDATNAPYSAAEWARVWKLMFGAGSSFPNYGVFAGSGDGSHQPLEVRATSVLSSNVEVQIGAALIDGRFYETTATVTLAIGSNSSGNARIDTVILRLDYAAQTVRLAVKQGTPAASPARPSLQQDTTFWEIPLADIAVANGFSTLAQSTISQRQRVLGMQSRGWQANAFPVDYVFGATPAVGSFNLTPAQTALMPILLTGNMLLYDIVVRHLVSVGVNYSFEWDLYFQDKNDGNSSENVIRRIAQSDGNNSLVSGGAANVALPVLGKPIPLNPGVYWLAIQNRHASNNLPLDYAVSGNAFDALIANLRLKVTTNPNGATIDASTSWTASANVPFVRLRGLVFGQTVPSN